jgi:catechol 2,3-dioxygenase-like lactoylglutathione lyase family enzyme
MNMSQERTREFHFTLKVAELERSTRFYSWLLDVPPKVTSQYHSVIVDPRSSTNLVLVASKTTEGGSANLHHLGLGCESKAALLAIHRGAGEHGFEIAEAPQTTWKGTPLHQLWLRDPEGHRVEVYARLTAEELASRPTDDRPVLLVEDPSCSAQ